MDFRLQNKTDWNYCRQYRILLHNNYVTGTDCTHIAVEQTGFPSCSLVE